VAAVVQKQHVMKMGWGRFAAMIAASTVIMFFLMYQLVYSAEHAMFSLNRLLASLIMGGVMTAIMLAFMWNMYQPQAVKVVVLIGGLLVAGVLLAVNRSQVREIAEMKLLLQDIDQNGERGAKPLKARDAALTPDM
jgi:peptidoglycan/LPS O-acetylase OafA/YrhL